MPAGAPPFIGLTGGMGAGKSTALAMLEELGAAPLSTDEVVRELLESNEIRDELVARFGAEVAPNGKVDRSAVATLVFAHPDERKWLEGVLWPRVGERVERWRREAALREPRPRALVVEVPLLFEAGMEAAFDHTIAVVTNEEQIAERTADREHVGVESRASRQLSQKEKAQRAEYVVRNDGDLDELRVTLSGLLENIGA